LRYPLSVFYTILHWKDSENRVAAPQLDLEKERKKCGVPSLENTLERIT